MKDAYTLMTPGPVPVPLEVLEILGLPMEHHRTPEFEAVLKRVLSRLKTVFETEQPAFMHTSTGSGGMESALINTLSPGDTVLAVVSGKFGERWAEMAEAFGARVIRLDIEWGQAARPEQIQELLRKHPDTRIVLTQACETSTAVLHPIRDIAEVVSKTDALLLVDGITALGALPLPMDEWQIDAIVGGSQKAFMLPTGLSFISFSKKAWPRVESARTPRFYFDIRAEHQANLRGETLFSSSVPLVKALDVVLDRVMRDGGMHVIHERIQKLSHATHSAIEEMGLRSYAQSPSPSLTAIALPDGVDGQKLRSDMEKTHRVVVMGGQDKLKGRIIRIGHMGAISNQDLLKTLDAFSQALNALKPGAVSDTQRKQALDAAEKALNA